YGSHTEWHPTNILAFQIDRYDKREWADNTEPLENKLPSIIAKLELIGKEWHDWRAARKQEENLQKEKERIALELKERKEKELQDFKEVLQDASRWHHAVNLRNFIDAVEQKTAAT